MKNLGKKLIIVSIIVIAVLTIVTATVLAQNENGPENSACSRDNCSGITGVCENAGNYSECPGNGGLCAGGGQYRLNKGNCQMDAP